MSGKVICITERTVVMRQSESFLPMSTNLTHPLFSKRAQLFEARLFWGLTVVSLLLSGLLFFELWSSY